MDFISGEKFQQICSVYFGEQEDFSFNPRILHEKHKHKYISRFTKPFYNPILVFCYTHRIKDLAPKLHLFKNKFILLSHNSDYTITEQDIGFLENDIIIHWFSQNANVVHPKLTPIPIGIGNQQWDHGNYSHWDNLNSVSNDQKDGVYFYFSTDTNPTERLKCKQILQSKGLEYWNHMPHQYYIDNLARFCKYSICPVGNGVDTHRLWEALYTDTIPVCLKTVNSEYFSKEYPILLLDKWEDFDVSTKNPDVQFDTEKLKFSYYINKIHAAMKI
jgi:hypothetical protein